MTPENAKRLVPAAMALMVFGVGLSLLLLANDLEPEPPGAVARADVRFDEVRTLADTAPPARPGPERANVDPEIEALPSGTRDPGTPVAERGPRLDPLRHARAGMPSGEPRDTPIVVERRAYRGIDDATFERVIQRWTAPQACRIQHSAESGTSIRLRLTIDEAGRVAEADTEDASSGAQLAIAECLKARASELFFPDESGRPELQRVATFVF